MKIPRKIVDVIKESAVIGEVHSIAGTIVSLTANWGVPVLENVRIYFAASSGH